MQGEYVEPKIESNAMFSKFNHRRQPQALPFPHPFQLSARECQILQEEEEEEQEEASPAIRTPSRKPVEPSSGDGSTIEVIKRPRGRPPGSKNKPKQAVAVTSDPEPSMSPYILEVPGGSDVIVSIARFCRRKNIGLCVLSGSGTVSNVTLQQPSATPGTTVTFHGRFHILSISATFIPDSTAFSVPNGFGLYLAGPQGQIVGGIVSGSLIAADTVFVIASTFNNPSYHRLPDEDETRNSAAGSGGERNSSPASDGIWATTARPPPPRPPY